GYLIQVLEGLHRGIPLRGPHPVERLLDRRRNPGIGLDVGVVLDQGVMHHPRHVIAVRHLPFHKSIGAVRLLRAENVRDIGRHRAHPVCGLIADGVDHPGEIVRQKSPRLDPPLHVLAPVRGALRAVDVGRPHPGEEIRDLADGNTGGLIPGEQVMDGQALHYLLTGDEASRVAVGKVAYLFSWMWTPYINCTQCTANGGEYVEGRIQARTLLSHYLAWMINAVGDQPTNWVSTMATDVTNILSTQQSDGSYRFVEWEMAHSNYMTGMMHDALIKYYTYVQPDPRIPPAIKKTLDWMWATQWDTSVQAFKYLDQVTSTGGTTPYPDLNGLIVTGYG